MSSKPSSAPLHWEIESTTMAVEMLSRQIMSAVREAGFEEGRQFAIHLALEEALVNAVHHGNKGDPSRKVIVDCLIDDEKFDITISDQGPGFDPDSVPDPRCPENLYKCSGRGVLLIYAYMDKVEFSDSGSTLRLVKYRHEEDAGPRDIPPTCGE